MCRMAILLLLLAPLAPAQEPVSFQKQIQPILARQCVACHQPQSRQAELLLTTYEGFHKGGRKGTPWVAGNPTRAWWSSTSQEPRSPRCHLAASRWRNRTSNYSGAGFEKARETIARRPMP